MSSLAEAEAKCSEAYTALAAEAETALTDNQAWHILTMAVIGVSAVHTLQELAAREPEVDEVFQRRLAQVEKNTAAALLRLNPKSLELSPKATDLCNQVARLHDPESLALDDLPTLVEGLRKYLLGLESR